MIKPAKSALLMLISAAGLAQTSSKAPAAPATAPAATTTPSAATPATASGAPTLTGVPLYRAGMRGRPGTTAPTATANVSITGGKGDDPTGIDPQSGSLAVPRLKNSLGIASGTAIHVRLSKPVDSGHAKNGDMLEGVLVAPLGSAPAGAPVRLTVVAAAAAGAMSSAGELSVQVISINGETILSNVITAEGETGKTEFADDNPGRGTEASFTPDKPLNLPAA